MSEKNIIHKIPIDISMYNVNGDFTPSAYQRMIMSMIEEHLDMLNLGEKHLMEEYGISWVLLSTSIEFKRKINPTDKLVGITWHSGGRVPSFRRDFIFEDDEIFELVRDNYAKVNKDYLNEQASIALAYDLSDKIDKEAPEIVITKTKDNKNIFKKVLTNLMHHVIIIM